MTVVWELARQAFHRTADGRLLFAPYWPLFRPYLVPDDATRDRLARRYVWAVAASFALGAAAIAAAFLRPGAAAAFLTDPAYFFGGMAALSVIALVAMKAVLWGAVRRLPRHPERLPLRSMPVQLARDNPRELLALLAWGLTGMGAAGLLLTASAAGGGKPIIQFGAVATAGFGLVCGHAYFIRRAMDRAGAERGGPPDTGSDPY